MSNQPKFIQSLLTLAIAGTLGVLAGCSGGSSDPDTTTSSTAVAVAPQGVIQSDAVYCSDTLSDPDGDGWGWENNQSCKIGNAPVATINPTMPTPAETNPVQTAPIQTASNLATATGEDLPVGIVYYLWHCKAKESRKQNNITEVLKGQSAWGAEHTFHWWDKPSEGYYCLGDQPGVIARHLKLLRDAGINYLVLDMTNHPNTKSLEANTFILKSLRPLLEAARSIPNAPKIVPWVPFTSENAGTRNERNNACTPSSNAARCRALQQAEPMYQHVTNLLNNEYPELRFEYNGKPLLLEAANDNTYPRTETDVVRPQLESNWSVQRMWGLGLTNDEWSFLSTCDNPVDFYASHGWSEAGCNQSVNMGQQISVTAAYQYTYISEAFTPNARSYAGYTGGMPKFYGRTMAQQFRVAFEHRDAQPMVLLTGWNEWIAQRFELNGRVAFVDLYDDTLNRDIEPGGASGDLYYYLMRDLITEYRNNKPFAFEDYFLTKNSILDTDYYWNKHTDLQAAYAKEDKIGLRNHWLSVGIQEGRSPSVAFNATHYLNNNADLFNAGISSAEALLNHFINAGFQEGRRGSAEFHAKTYIAGNRQVAALYGNNGYYKSFKHFIGAM